jgi:hypothetical protein
MIRSIALGVALLASILVSGCGADSNMTAAENAAFKHPDASTLKPPSGDVMKPPSGFHSSLGSGRGAPGETH